MAARPILTLERFLPYRLSVLSNALSSAIARTYQSRFGLSITEWRVLAVLGRHPGLSASEVAERTGMDKVAVSRAVNALLDDARLQRDADAHDRRRWMLALSVEGQAIYDQIVPMVLDFEQALLVNFSSAERRQLFALLDRLELSRGEAEQWLDAAATVASSADKH